LPSLPYLRWFFLFDDTTGHQLSGLVEENSRNVPTVENIHISTNEPPTALSTHPWYSLLQGKNKHVYYVENEVGERV
ncbi:hypothetical protein KCU69_g29, partial [Aureobasidium melanogenum]